MRYSKGWRVNNLFRLPLVLRSKLRLRSSAHRQRYGRSDHVLSQDLTKTRYERIQAWTTVVTALTAVVALGFSLSNYMQLNRKPVIQMVMPKVIRIEQGTAWTNLFVQPSFTVQEKTDVAGVISSVKVELQDSVHTRKPHFYWWGIAEFSPNQNNAVAYKYGADPAPIIVTQDKPQQSHLRFSTVIPAFEAGKWQGSLIVERQGRSALVAPFCIDITTDDIQIIKQANGAYYCTFRNDEPIEGAQTSDPGCYKRTLNDH
jgi:hypothetical protein